MNKKRYIPMSIGLLILLILLVGGCQSGTETATEETVTSTSPAANPEPPESVKATETPESSASVSDFLTAAISELQGLVEMKQANQDAFLDASTDEILDVNGQVRTGDNGKARLDLSSGTIVRVSPSSLFTLIENEEVDKGLATKIKLELGRIFVILSGGSLEVETPSGVASVRGSYLKVEYNPEEDTLELTCLEGDCSVVTPDGKTTNFTDGQKVVIHKDPDTGTWVVDEGSMNSDDFNEWLENNPEAKVFVEAGLAALEETSNSCVTLLHPENGSDFLAVGGVNFEWESQEGAANYILSFTYPSGQVVQFQTTETNMTRYIESMPPGGDYTWTVAAYDEGGDLICTSESLVFTKDETGAPKEEPKKDEDPSPTSQPPTSPPPTSPPPTSPPPTSPPPTSPPPTSPPPTSPPPTSPPPTSPPPTSPPPTQPPPTEPPPTQPPPTEPPL